MIASKAVVRSRAVTRIAGFMAFETRAFAVEVPYFAFLTRAITRRTVVSTVLYTVVLDQPKAVMAAQAVVNEVLARFAIFTAFRAPSVLEQVSSKALGTRE